MIKISAILLGLFCTSVSIYSISVNDIDGTVINLSVYEGKKILIVNTATQSRHVGQLAMLEQLHQLYGDSLVIIAIPSNSFGKEPLDNNAIKSFVQSQFNIHFILAAKSNVIGTEKPAIYNWLTEQSQNGTMNNTMYGDFQKFLIDKDGKLMGVFAPIISPMDISIQQAITGN